MTAIIDYLAERGLVFIKGLPPESEDGTLLVWTGGCNAVIARWSDGTLIESGEYQPIDLADVVCWMRLPHPSIWPFVDAPVALVSERDLYSAKGDVLSAFVKCGS